MSENKKIFKILSIDGGGIKGLYSLYVLKQFEEKYCRGQNTTLADHFDMICGTSTGGLIALGLASGKNIDEIIKLYEDNATIIFPEGWYTNFFSKLIMRKYYAAKQLLGSKYNNCNLIKIVNNFFGTITLGQAKNLLCIPSYQLETNQNIVFTYHKGKPTRDVNIKMADVALATSAAPTYFPPYYFETGSICGHFVDGGIWANNPSLVGISEACNFFVGNGKEYDDFDVLSIGNIIANDNPKPQKSWFNKIFGISYWNIGKFSNLIGIIFSSNANAIKFHANTFSEYVNKVEDNVTRIECKNFSTSANNIGLDNSSQDFLKSLKSAGCSDGINHDTKNNKIWRFFEATKTYNTSN
jgi:hypothetical protein